MGRGTMFEKTVMEDLTFMDLVGLFAREYWWIVVILLVLLLRVDRVKTSVIILFVLVLQVKNLGDYLEPAGYDGLTFAFILENGWWIILSLLLLVGWWSLGDTEEEKRRRRYRDNGADW